MRISLSPRLRPRSHRGFTLLEITIVSAFMGFLAVLISTTWSAFIRPTAEMAQRCRIAQEANLAVASLSRDLAGSLADNPTGNIAKFRLVGRMQPDNSRLRLCFDGGSTPNGTADWSDPDTIVTYYVDSHQLIRWDENAGTIFNVAKDIDNLYVEDLGDGTVLIRMTFQFRSISQTYNLIARDP
jgi:type II secretory pathway component PulJ